MNTANLSAHVFLLFIAVAARLLFHSCGPLAAESPESLVSRAETLFRDKKFSEALTSYEKAVSLDPACTRAYRGLIRCYGELGDAQGAVIQMESLYLENPESAAVCYGLGYALYATRTYDAAKTYFEKAVRINPDMGAAWNNVAAIYHFVDQDYDRARTCYEKAIAVSGRTGDTRVRSIAEKNLANLPTAKELKAANETLSLEEFINRYIALVEENSDRAAGLLVAHQKKNSEEALDWFLEEAMRASAEGRKEDEKTMVALAALLENEYRKSYASMALKNRLDAYAALDDRKKQGVFEGNRLLRQGRQHEQQGSWQAALQCYRDALACFERIADKGKQGMALVYLGDLYRSRKDYSAARRAYSDALTCFVEIRDDEQKALALSSLGITYYMLGEHGDALSFLRRSEALYRRMKDEMSASVVKQNIERIEAVEKK